MNPIPSNAHATTDPSQPDLPKTAAETDASWPMEVADHQPLVFNPQGFLVAIVDDADEAKAARVTLLGAGFADRDLRAYSSEQILEGHEQFVAGRSLMRRVVGAFTDDPDTVALYFGYARAGRAALWIRVEHQTAANRAMRALADHGVLHFRYFGIDTQQDIHIR